MQAGLANWYTRLMDRLVELKEAWAKSADRAEELRDAYHAAIVDELESGRRSQADVARITGYSREWLRVLTARRSAGEAGADPRPAH
jgi:hypothetical protein